MTARKHTRRKAVVSRKSPTVGAELADIITRLQLAEATAYTAAAALSVQAADADPDIAIALRHHVGGELTRQIERLKGLAGARLEGLQLVVGGVQ